MRRLPLMVRRPCCRAHLIGAGHSNFGFAPESGIDTRWGAYGASVVTSLNKEHTMTRLRLLAALVAVVALMAAACGGDDDTSASDVEATTSIAETTAPTPGAAVDPTTPTVEPTPTSAIEAPELTEIILYEGGYPAYGPDRLTVPVLGAPEVFVADDGRPRVVYLAGPSTIEIATCVDVDCRAVDTATLVDIAPAGRISHNGIGFNSDGRPMVVYWGFDKPDRPAETDGFTVVLWCVDVSCDTVEDTEVARGFSLTPFSRVAFGTSPDGRRYVATLGIAGGGRFDIRLTDCAEPLCSPTTSDVIVVPAEFVTDKAFGFTPAGAPVLAFTTQTNTSGTPGIRRLYYLACEDPTCVPKTDPVSILKGKPGVGLNPQPPIVTDSGVTVVVRIEDNGPAQIIVITCEDPTCADPTSTTVLGRAGSGVDVALGGDGLPRIAWTDTNGQVNYSRCLDLTCATLDTTTLDATAGQLALAIGDHTVYIATGIYPASLLVCPAELCPP